MHFTYVSLAMAAVAMAAVAPQANGASLAARAPAGKGNVYWHKCG